MEISGSAPNIHMVYLVTLLSKMIAVEGIGQSIPSGALGSLIKGAVSTGIFQLLRFLRGHALCAADARHLSPNPPIRFRLMPGPFST
jgi:hypothetical protein